MEMAQRPKQQISLLTDLHAAKEKSRERPLSASKGQRQEMGCHHKRQSTSSKKEDHSSRDSNQHLIKKSTIIKQQNIPSPIDSPVEFIKYSASDESPLVEVMVRQSDIPRQRSKSTVTTREPWSELLKKHKTGKSDSVFSNFDPLRSLHFLAKELEINLQMLLPDDKGVKEILIAMQNALKRVPPEVASTIHLQQTIELLPSSRKSPSFYGLSDTVPEKLSKQTASKKTQTSEEFEKEEVAKIQKIMEENTLKLETSCRHLESIGQQLQSDKLYLETQLQNERANTEFYRKRVEDLEEINRNLINKITKKDDEIQNLQSEIVNLKSKIEEKNLSQTDTRSFITELKRSNSNLDQQCSKLQHQLRVCAIEKEKYVAILAVRDKQINEIRNEMAELQQVVTEQLVELNTNAIAGLPSNFSEADIWKADQNKENIGDGTMSSIHDEGENVDQENQNKQTGFQSGDSDVFQHLPVNNRSDNVKRLFDNTEDKITIPNEIPVFSDDKYPFQTSCNTIKDMVCELKNQAFILTDPYKH